MPETKAAVIEDKVKPSISDNVEDAMKPAENECITLPSLQLGGGKEQFSNADDIILQTVPIKCKITLTQEVGGNVSIDLKLLGDDASKSFFAVLRIIDMAPDGSEERLQVFGEPIRIECGSASIMLDAEIVSEIRPKFNGHKLRIDVQ